MVILRTGSTGKPILGSARDRAGEPGSPSGSIEGRSRSVHENDVDVRSAGLQVTLKREHLSFTESVVRPGTYAERVPVGIKATDVVSTSAKDSVIKPNRERNHRRHSRRDRRERCRREVRRSHVAARRSIGPAASTMIERSKPTDGVWTVGCRARFTRGRRSHPAAAGASASFQAR